MKWQDYIVSDQEVLLVKPTIKGTRISVEHIIGFVAQGWSEDQILENFPRLSKESIQAAIKSTGISRFFKNLIFSPSL